MTLRRIAVKVCRGEPVDEGIWRAFEKLSPVAFDAHERTSSPDALILISPDDDSLRAAAATGRPCLAILQEAQPFHPRPSAVSFSCHPGVDARLHGRVLQHGPVDGFRGIALMPGDAVFASLNDTPCWVTRNVDGTEVQLVGLPVPRVKPGERPFDYLNGSHFMPLLPLLHFVRQVVGSDGWQPPPPSASFMFDDPNLHWPSYGFIRYRELSRLAKHERFHVAFATVPLDSWYVHQGTAAIFREHESELSLLIHGNDHLRQELGSERTDQQSVRLLAQALQRTAVLERRSGLRISRVMAAPHGACRPDMTQSMSLLGFTGACISPWSLRDWGGDREWPVTFGLQPVEPLEDEFPVVPRFGLSAGCEGWVVVNAFLNRPMIPVGHHNSTRNGLELLSVVAGYINRVPGVRWSNMETIVESSFFTRREDSTLHIRPFASRIVVTIPSGICSISIHSDGLKPESAWISSIDPATKALPGGSLPVRAGDVVTVCRAGWNTLDYRSVRVSTSYGAPIRRILCEVRDRLEPLAHWRK